MKVNVQFRSSLPTGPVKNTRALDTPSISSDSFEALQANAHLSGLYQTPLKDLMRQARQEPLTILGLQQEIPSIPELNQQVDTMKKLFAAYRRQNLENSDVFKRFQEQLKQNTQWEWVTLAKKLVDISNEQANYLYAKTKGTAPLKMP